MKIIHTKINHEDDRGMIRDICTHTPIDAITYITFSEGAIRANHFHKKTEQYDFIISGSLLCRSRKDGTNEIEELVVKAGDYIAHPALFHHAYKAIEPSVMISATHGPRQGDEYENDTYRLEGDQKLFA